jgi:hypothetical protein
MKSCSNEPPIKSKRMVAGQKMMLRARKTTVVVVDYHGGSWPSGIK